jgi:phage-related minor tail protein
MASDVIVKFGADLTELSKAFKQAEDDSKGLGSSLSSAMTSIGGGLKDAGMAMSAAVTVPIVAIATFAMKSASDVNGAMRSIERQTGLTGAALDSVKTQFLNVASNVPEDIGKVSSVFTTLISTLGLIGPQLESVSKQMIDMARIMGVDAVSAAESLSTVFKAFNVPASEMGNRMDELTYVSQNTGVGFDDLSDTMAKAAPIARAAGIGFDETAVMIANFAAAGLPARQSISMLSSVITKLSADGKDAGTEWTKLIQRFKEGKESADDIALLGANVVKFRDAVKTGKIGTDELMDGIKASHGLIEKESEATKTFGERLQILRNRLEIAFAPIGSAIFATLNALLDLLNPVIDIVLGITKAFETLPMPIKMVIVIIGGIAAALGPVLLVVGMIIASLAPLGPMIATIFGFLTGGGIMAALVGIAGIITPFLPLIAGILAVVIAITIPLIAIGLALVEAWRHSTELHDIFNKIKTILSEFAGHMTAAFGKLMSGDIKGALDEVKKGFTDLIAEVKKIDWATVGKEIITQTVKGIRGDIELIKGVWDEVRTTIANWINQQNWEDVGSQLAGIIVKAFRGALNIGQALNEAITAGTSGGPMTDAEQAADAAKYAAGKPSQKYYGPVPSEVTSAGGTPESYGESQGWVPEGGSKLMTQDTTSLTAAGVKAAEAFVKGLRDALGAYFRDGAFESDVGKWVSTINWLNVALLIIGGIIASLTLGGSVYGPLAGNAIGGVIRSGLTGMSWIDIAGLILQGIYTSIMLGAPLWGPMIGNAIKDLITTALVAVFGKDPLNIAFVVGLTFGPLGMATYLIVKWLYDTFIAHSTKYIVFDIQGLAWGEGFLQAVYNAIVWLAGFVAKSIPFILSGLAWMGGFAKDVYDAIVWIYNNVKGALAIAFGISVTGDSGLLQTVYDTLKNIAALFGKTGFSTLSGGITFDVKVLNLQALEDLYTKIKNVVDQIKNIPSSVLTELKKLPGVSEGLALLSMQSGGVIGPRSGGVPVMVAEAGKAEAIIPEDLFWGIDPRILDSLPKYGSGAIVGSTNLPSGNVRQTSAVIPNTEYNAYVTVDSENITRKVFQAFQEMENYHHL